ncbi:hypothetical protein [Halococcus sp. IIIV-5B]|uniref:hypothetical protein n=1 Tax=Halococcus sp. IIIV-5B TaxID=2321230 RepID=UPI000E73DC9C|nr:hypothetical protein [Halococcus sp. IIIV-5B]RJT03898.1 hypothetical protein D3261_10705 [Halococcus sp. IIIV-5B]
MRSELFGTVRDLRQWISALSAAKRLLVLLGSGGIALATQGIATAEEQEAVVVVVASVLSLVAVLVALHSVYALLRPFVSSATSGDADEN